MDYRGADAPKKSDSVVVGFWLFWYNLHDEENLISNELMKNLNYSALLPFDVLYEGVSRFFSCGGGEFLREDKITKLLSP